MGLRATLGALVIELAANHARLQGDLGKAVGHAERAAAKIKSVFKFAGGGLLGAALINAAKQSIEFGDSINKASIKAGIGAKQMSELAYAAKLADVDIGSLSTAIKKMQVSLSEAGTGAKGPTLALAALGLTIDEVKKRKPEQQFELLADRISKLTDPADRARAATELFGKAGADLLPLFEQGAEGIAKARAEAEKLGLSFSGEQIKKLADADDSIKRLDASWKGFATTLTATVAPSLSRIFDLLSGIDSRSAGAKNNEDIRLMEMQVGDVRAGRSFLPKDQLAALETKLEQAKARRELINAPSLAGTGGGRGRSAITVGFAGADAAEKAKEAAKKSRDEDLKFHEKWAKDSVDINRELNKQFGEDLDVALAEDRERYIDYYIELDEIRKKDAKDLAAWRREQEGQLSETTQIVKDGLMQSWDNWVRGGKFKIDELFTYFLLEFGKRGLAKLFDSMFSGTPGGGFGGGIGKFFGDIFGGLGGLFGGGRASGGNVQAGKIYEVGERGPELFAPGGPGSIIPHGAMGGNTVTALFKIDARGSTVDSVKLLNQMAPRIVDAAVAKMTEGLNRRSLGVR